MTPGHEEYTETIPNPPYEGTIIDVETNHHCLPICFGSLHNNQLSILYISDDEPETWDAHTHAITSKLTELPRPYLAFRATFDQEVTSDLLGQTVSFDGDLHVLPYSKDRAHRKLGGKPIPDPLKGQSSQVPILWDKYLRRKHQFLLDRIIKHNRACLLKETHISQQAGWKPISNYVIIESRSVTMNPVNETIRRLLQAITEKRIVEVTYQNSKGDETTRQIAALTLGHQYFTGYCYLRNELRTFKIKRLIQLKLTKMSIEDTAVHL